jgi:ribonuclease PH
MGNTKVICTAIVENSTARHLVGTGQGWVTAEYAMLPGSTGTRKKRDKGKTDGRSVEIQRLIGRALRSVVDMEKLGERMITVDCDVLQADGGTRCASITGGMVALEIAINKLIKDKVIETTPLTHRIAAVSVGICGGKPTLDLDYEHDSSADVDFNVVMTDDGRFVELQGTAEHDPFSADALESLLSLARKGLKKIFAIQKGALKS